MATENGRVVMTYLAIRPPPQASKKLNPPHRSPALPRRGPPFLPHRHCPLVRAAGTTGADSMVGTGDDPAPCG